ncbi:MAG: 4-hydroxybenzoate octaprenyltransferase [Pseudomonadota bacterium]
MQTGIYRHMPKAWHPYMQLARIDRPIGSWLLFLPCLWGMALAQGSDIGQNILWVALFAVGSLIARSAGCVWNDFADRDFDKRVARTASRPLASGVLQRSHAIFFLIGLLLLCFVIFAWANIWARWLLIASIPLVLAYPFMKRITYWPQLWLGLTFNWGVLVAYAQMADAWPNMAALCLYGCGVFWTLGYDTIYAHQDIADDLIIGVKSTAIKFGDKSTFFVMGFYAVALIMLGTALYVAQKLVFWALLAVPLFAWQFYRLDLQNPLSCLRTFRNNRFIGMGIALVVLLAGIYG